MEDIDKGAHAAQQERINGYVTGVLPMKFLKYASDDGYLSLSREEIASILGNGAEKGMCAYFVAMPRPDEAALLAEFELKKAMAARYRTGDCGNGCGECNKQMYEELMDLVPERIDCYFIGKIGDCRLGDRVPASVPVISLEREAGVGKGLRVRR
jgi:hypothetical protein